MTCGEVWQTDLMQRRDRIDWRPATAADSYNVYTASLNSVDSMSPTCKAQGVTDTQFPMTDAMAPGEGVYILISVVLPDGTEKPFGQDSNGADRPNPMDCAMFPPAARVAAQ